MGRAKFRADQLVVLVDGFGGELDGAPVGYRTGTVLRGDHPAVKKWPQFFAPAGDREATEEIRRKLYERVWQEPDYAPAATIPASLKDEDALVATRDFTVWI